MIDGEIIVVVVGNSRESDSTTWLEGRLHREIIAWLDRRERRKRLRANPDNRQGHWEANTHCTAEHPHAI
jgi:hypothetical protein